MKARLPILLSVVGALAFAPSARGQHRPTDSHAHPEMPDKKPPPLHFPMSADNFRKLATWYTDLAHKNESHMSDESRSRMNLAILRMRACEAQVTADGVVTSHEAQTCLRTLDVVIRPRPR